jgi:hypothetical protein
MKPEEGSMEISLHDRVALVTGGGRGLGARTVCAGG